jgi:mono/diheme cytochrome c family protein
VPPRREISALNPGKLAVKPFPSTSAKLIGLFMGAGLVALAPAWSASATPASNDDDDREIQRVEARRSFVENCLMCHGEDMTSRQRLTTKQWTAEVEKMVNWGAPLPPDRKQPMIDYLVELYPAGQVAPPPERIDSEKALALDPQPMPVQPLPGSDPKRGEAVFATHCAVCHGATAVGGEMGTNLVEKPVLLRVEEFRSVMKEGRRRMPGFAAVLDDRSQSDLLAWLRLRR